MKNKISYLILVICFVSISSITNAKVWRLNNNAGIDADFNNFTTAQNAASNGDTIYVEGSPTSYGNITISKQLIIIGTGYFLTENPQTQANLNSAKFGTVNFNTGSSGSVITGLELTGTITINVALISVIRNYAKNININSSTSYGNIFISQNYINGGISNSSGSAQIFNVTISNNIAGCGSYCSVINLGTNYSGAISNNVFFSGDVSAYNFVFTNNIRTCCSVNLNNNTFFNNIGDGTQFPAGNGNQQSITMADVFVGYPTQGSYSSDGRYQLKSGSPAIGAGNDGTDCGIFGGVTPYVLSGMPEIPAIYEINMPSTGTTGNGINVTVKAKSH